MMLWMWLTAALAQDGATATLEVDPWRLDPSGLGALSVQNGDVLPHLYVFAGATTQVVGSGLVLEDPDTGATQENIIGNRYGGQFRFAMGIADVAEWAVHLPGTLNQQATWLASSLGDVPASGWGDLALRLKGQFLRYDRHGASLALSTQMSFPTAPPDAWLSTEGYVWTTELIASGEVGPATLMGSLGYRMQPRLDVGDVVDDDKLLAGFGARVQALPWLRVDLETTLWAQASAPFQSLRETGALANGQLVFTPGDAGVELQAGGGAGLTKAIGNPGWRAFFGIAWRPPGPKNPTEAPSEEGPPAQNPSDETSDPLEALPLAPTPLDDPDAARRMPASAPLNLGAPDRVRPKDEHLPEEWSEVQPWTEVPRADPTKPALPLGTDPALADRASFLEDAPPPPEAGTAPEEDVAPDPEEAGAETLATEEAASDGLLTGEAASETLATEEAASDDAAEPEAEDAAAPEAEAAEADVEPSEEPTPSDDALLPPSGPTDVLEDRTEDNLPQLR